jgi:HlyD family secretion protein
MKSQPKQIFRQKSIEGLSSPEQIDQTMRVVSPKAWLPLTAVAFLAISAASWSVLGRIPMTVNGEAVLIQPGSILPLQATSTGQISKLLIEEGEEIGKQVIAELEQQQALEQEQQISDRQKLISQQLAQQRSRLGELRKQNNQTKTAFKQQLNSQRQNLETRKTNLENSLAGYEKLERTLNNKTSEYYNAMDKLLKDSLESAKHSTDELKKNLETHEKLLKKTNNNNTRNLVSNSKRLLEANQSKITDLEAKIEENELKKIQFESQKLENTNKIQQTKNEIKSIELDKAELKLNEKERINEKDNQINEIKRQIDQLELKSDLLKQNKYTASEKNDIKSQHAGTITEIPVVTGQIVSPGTRIASIQVKDSNAKPNSIVMYFADTDGNKISKNDQVQVSPNFVERERYGGIVGKVTEISSNSVTIEKMTKDIGNQNTANTIFKKLSDRGGSVVRIVAELEENEDNPTGYEWSSSSGPDRDKFEISSGMEAQVQVTVEEVSPISFVIPIFRSLTGIY